MFYILFLFICFESSGQTPDYFANSPTWNCGYWKLGQMPPSSETLDQFVYYLDGDSTISGELYHRVFKRGITDSLITPNPIDSLFDYHTKIYIRQVDRTIRFCDISLNIVDSLLVDYTTQVGIAPQGHVFIGIPTANNIQKIDSVQINSEYRRVFHLDTLVGNRFIEGIGHQSDTINEIGEMFLPEWTNAGGYQNFIYCYGQNSQSYWQSTINSSCELTVTINEIENNSKPELIRITDLMGRETEDTPNNPLIYIYSDGTTEKVFRME